LADNSYARIRDYTITEYIRQMLRKLLTGLTLFLVSVAASAQSAPTDGQIRTAIAKLDVGTDENGFGEFDVLYKSPRRSAKILIASLKPVRRGHTGQPDPG
jgi:hypothetical protein